MDVSAGAFDAQLWSYFRGRMRFETPGIGSVKAQSLYLGRGAFVLPKGVGLC